MDLLHFDRKRGRTFDEDAPTPSGSFEVDVLTNVSIVRNRGGEDEGRRLHEQGHFGHFLWDEFRQSNAASADCEENDEVGAKMGQEDDWEPETKRRKSVDPNSRRPDDPESRSGERRVKNGKKRGKQAANGQNGKNLVRCTDTQLRLNVEETLFLCWRGTIVAFKEESLLDCQALWEHFTVYNDAAAMARQFLVYTRLRDDGWVPAAGTKFGVDYLIYKYGPDYYHATAGVKIASSLAPSEMIAYNRCLFNARKALIVATVDLPENSNLAEFSALQDAYVELQVQSTFFPNRHRE
ncbi:unnamed protein product, partial [Mesorhabditis spiculigera]